MFSAVFTENVKYLNSLPGCVREVDNGHCIGDSTSSIGTRSQHTSLSDGATIYSAIGQNQAKETIEEGPYNWGGINRADHLRNHQALPIHLGTARILPIHTRQMT